MTGGSKFGGCDKIGGGGRDVVPACSSPQWAAHHHCSGETFIVKCYSKLTKPKNRDCDIVIQSHCDTDHFL